jgi:hypothetical protein
LQEGSGGRNSRRFSFGLVEREACGVRVVVKAHVVEDEELGLGAEVGRVGDARELELLQRNFCPHRWEVKTKTFARLFRSEFGKSLRRVCEARTTGSYFQASLARRGVVLFKLKPALKGRATFRRR